MTFRLNVELRWRIAGLFGGGALVLTALLTGLGVTLMAQTQFATTEDSVLESVEGASLALSTALASHTTNLSPVVKSAARAAAGNIYWLTGGQSVAQSTPGKPPPVVFSLPAPAYPEVTFAVDHGTWLVAAAAPVSAAPAAVISQGGQISAPSAKSPVANAPISTAAAGPGATVQGEVVLIRRLSALQTELTAIQRRLWTVGAIAALLFAGLGFLFARSIAAPLERLKRAAERMSAGDLEQRVALEGSGEVVTLSRTFNEMAQRVATQDALRRQFVADAAHELRTPVAGMQVLAESLIGSGDEDLPHGVRTGLEGIRRESERLSRLIQQLLALARLDNPEGSLHLEPLRVTDLLHEALWVLRPVALQRDVDLRVKEVDGAWIRADPDWLHRAILNVLDNAIRHSPDGVPINITVRQVGGFVEIEVADRGPGVPPEALRRLGERFVRVTPAREASSGGAGLGLAIVKDVLSRHGGEVRFENRSEGGLAVTLRLPAARPSSP